MQNHTQQNAERSCVTRTFWRLIPFACSISIFLAFGWGSNLSARPASQESGIPSHILTFESFSLLSSQTSVLTDSTANADDEQEADNEEIQVSFTIFDRQFDLELHPSDSIATVVSYLYKFNQTFDQR